MTTQLGTLEELPADYRQSMEGERVSPLWPMMRNVLPHDQPNPVTKPALWSFERIRPLLLKAGELTPVEKAERRVLVLNDPGRGKGAMQVTSSIYVGLQLLLPGEKARSEEHTSELQSPDHLVCRLLLEKKKKKQKRQYYKKKKKKKKKQK